MAFIRVGAASRDDLLELECVREETQAEFCTYLIRAAQVPRGQRSGHGDKPKSQVLDEGKSLNITFYVQHKTAGFLFSVSHHFHTHTQSCSRL